MSILIKPGDAWQEPEHIQSQNPDGVLRDVEVVRAKIGSEYVDVWPTKLWLYQDGDECSKVTGGWTAYPYRFGANSATNNIAKTPTVTKTAQSIKLFEPSGYYRGSLFTEQPINMTNYNTLKVHIVSAVAKKVPEHNAFEYLARALICIPLEKKDSYNEKENTNIVQANDITIRDKMVELDISRINEKRYIVFTFMTVASDMTIEFDKAWLER